ncbi:MAG TPA: hypothetical protein VKA15_25745, partial [Isosphaeraceae bacterium]|nr:hypothetical protein [Isosphaeraceae bacterium]
MPRSRKQATGPKAVRTTRVPKRPRNRYALNRAMGLVLSVTIVLGVVSRGQEPGSRSEPVTLQEPATATPSRTKTPGATPLGLDTAAVRAETVERIKVFEASAAPNDKASATGTASPKPASGSVAAAVSSSPDRAVGSASRPAPIDPAVSKSIPELLHDRLRLLEEHDRICAALHQATHPEPSPERQAAEAKTDLDRLQKILTQA